MRQTDELCNLLLRLAEPHCEFRTAPSVSFRQTGLRDGQGVCREEDAFSVEQIVAVLKQAELGLSVAELICRVEIPE